MLRLESASHLPGLAAVSPEDGFGKAVAGIPLACRPREPRPFGRSSPASSSGFLPPPPTLSSAPRVSDLLLRHASRAEALDVHPSTTRPRPLAFLALGPIRAGRRLPKRSFGRRAFTMDHNLISSVRGAKSPPGPRAPGSRPAPSCSGRSPPPAPPGPRGAAPSPPAPPA